MTSKLPTVSALIRIQFSRHNSQPTKHLGTQIALLNGIIRELDSACKNSKQQRHPRRAWLLRRRRRLVCQHPLVQEGEQRLRKLINCRQRWIKWVRFGLVRLPVAALFISTLRPIRRKQVQGRGNQPDHVRILRQRLAHIAHGCVCTPEVYEWVCSRHALVDQGILQRKISRHRRHRGLAATQRQRCVRVSTEVDRRTCSIFDNVPAR